MVEDPEVRHRAVLLRILGDQAQALRHMEAALENAIESQRRVIERVYEAGATDEEIAVVMGISVEELRTRWGPRA